MIRTPWMRTLLGAACSRKDRRRPMPRRKPARLILESLEERLTPSGGQTAGSYNALTSAIAADTAANTNYVIDITSSFRFTSGGQVTISKLASGSSLTIEGNNGSIFDLRGNGNRLFDITSGQNVTLKDLTLTQGSVTSGTTHGGAILDNGGVLVLSNVAVENNSVQGAAGALGGGIYASGGSLTLEGGCTIQSNQVLGLPAAVGGNYGVAGGGVYVTGPSTVQITDSVISKNSVTGAKGATYSQPGSTGNTGGFAYGGGLYVAGNGWHVTLTGDTLSGNRAIGGDGGNGTAGGSTASTTGNNGGAGARGGNAIGAGAAFVVSGGASTSTLTILNDSSHPFLILDNTAQGGTGGSGGAGGAPYSTGKNSNGGLGGQGGFAQGGGVSITNEGANFTANIGNTSFYGNQALGGVGGAGGAAGTGGTGTAGSAGSHGGVGASAGGGLAIPVQQGNDTVKMVNSTVAANTALGGGSVGNTAGGGGIALAMATTTNPTFTLDNNTITQNTLIGGQSGGAGIEFEILSPPASPPPPAMSANLLLYNNVIQNNGTGSSAVDLDSIGSSGNTISNVTLSNAANNFIGTTNTNAVPSASNIAGNTQTQLGSAIGVDSQGNPTGGPIYYPLLFGTSSIGYGTTNVLTDIQSVEGTATATDAIGNPMPSTGPINLGAVQVVIPAITLQPSSQTATAGSNASFTAAAGGTPTPAVQWQVSTDGGHSWTNLTGATGATLILSHVGTAMNGEEYRAVFSNSVGDALTNAVTLTVNTPASPPSPPVLQVPPLLALFDNLLGGVETVNADGTQTITDRLLGIPLIVSTFDTHGNLESVLFLGMNLTFLFELL